MAPTVPLRHGRRRVSVGRRPIDSIVDVYRAYLGDSIWKIRYVRLSRRVGSVRFPDRGTSVLPVPPRYPVAVRACIGTVRTEKQTFLSNTPTAG